MLNFNAINLCKNFQLYPVVILSLFLITNIRFSVQISINFPGNIFLVIPSQSWICFTYSKLFLCRKLGNNFPHWKIPPSLAIYLQLQPWDINDHLFVMGALFLLQKPDRYKWWAIANKCSATIMRWQQISKILSYSAY